ncbi:hypothetical protein ACSMXN_21675 [Jatrophihabitans sp. DSM 45814]
MLTPDFSDHAQALVEQYLRQERTFQLRIRPTSPWVGMAPADVDLSGYPQMRVLGVRPDGTGGYVHQDVLAVDDAVVVYGDSAEVGRLARANELDGWHQDEASSLFTGEGGVAEVVIPPRNRRHLATRR